jgi:hypothetical protein
VSYLFIPSALLNNKERKTKMSKLLLSLITNRSSSSFFVLNRPGQQLILNRNQSNLASNSKSGDEFQFDETTNSTSFSQKPAEDLILNIPEAEEELEKQEKYRAFVERSRNVMRLPRSNAQRKLKKTLPIQYSDPDAQYLKNVNYYRKMYAKYGKASGIVVGLAWPSKEQLQTMIKDEQEYDLTLRQKVQILAERKKNELDSYVKLLVFLVSASLFTLSFKEV